jgi:hypothetical protein
MSDINEINDSFKQGILPDCLNFSLPSVDAFDWEKVKYNTFYKSYEFAEKKFPKGYENIPGFDKVIELCIPKMTPVEEIKLRMEKVKENNSA